MHDTVATPSAPLPLSQPTPQTRASGSSYSVQIARSPRPLDAAVQASSAETWGATRSGPQSSRKLGNRPGRNLTACRLFEGATELGSGSQCRYLSLSGEP